MVVVCVHIYREKEEDLEKKQFFINRELRPLMEIPGLLLEVETVVLVCVCVCEREREGKE